MCNRLVNSTCWSSFTMFRTTFTVPPIVRFQKYHRSSASRSDTLIYFLGLVGVQSYLSSHQTCSWFGIHHTTFSDFFGKWVSKPAEDNTSLSGGWSNEKINNNLTYKSRNIPRVIGYTWIYLRHHNDGVDRKTTKSPEANWWYIYIYYIHQRCFTTLSMTAWWIWAEQHKVFKLIAIIVNSPRYKIWVVNHSKWMYKFQPFFKPPKEDASKFQKLPRVRVIYIYIYMSCIYHPVYNIGTTQLMFQTSSKHQQHLQKTIFKQHLLKDNLQQHCPCFKRKHLQNHNILFNGKTPRPHLPPDRCLGSWQHRPGNQRWPRHVTTRFQKDGVKKHVHFYQTLRNCWRW